MSWKPDTSERYEPIREREPDAALEERRAYNKALEASPEFQKIEEEVDKEVFTLFTLDRIKDEEHYLVEYGDYEEPEYDDDWNEYEFSDEPDSSREKNLVPDEVDEAIERYAKYLRKRSNRIKEAKRLLEVYPDQPEHAASLFIQLGSCHWLWGMKKRLFKEKYGITWYTPAELNPDVIYD